MDDAIDHSVSQDQLGRDLAIVGDRTGLPGTGDRPGLARLQRHGCLGVKQALTALLGGDCEPHLRADRLGSPVLGCRSQLHGFSRFPGEMPRSSLREQNALSHPANRLDHEALPRWRSERGGVVDGEGSKERVGKRRGLMHQNPGRRSPAYTGRVTCLQKWDPPPVTIDCRILAPRGGRSSRSSRTAQAHEWIRQSRPAQAPRQRSLHAPKGRFCRKA